MYLFFIIVFLFGFFKFNRRMQGIIIAIRANNIPEKFKILIKALGIIYIVNDFTSLPPT